MTPPREQAETPARRAGKHDAEVARHRVEEAKVARSLQLGTYVARGVMVGLWLLAASVPLWALKGVVEPLSGKTTVVQANIVVSVTLALSVGLHGLQYAKAQSRKKRIKELRQRVKELEDKLL